MQINQIKNMSFGRTLLDSELQEYTSTLDEAKKCIGQTGKSVFIVHDVCLPQHPQYNTGAGNITSEESLDFFKFIKNHLGINAVEVLPQGQMPERRRFNCAYKSSALSLGIQEIDLKRLTFPEYNLLVPQDVEEVVKANNNPMKDIYVNFYNTTYNNSSQNMALRKAFQRFINLNDTNILKKEYKDYVNANTDWLEPKGIFSVLSSEIYNNEKYLQWCELDKNLYDKNFDATLREARKNEILKNYSQEIEFYKFKQFIADKH